VPAGKALTRDSAQVGDDIWLSGEIGRSAAALKDILAQPGTFIENNDDLAAAYYYPQAQVELGKKLIGLGNSALDISDGLLQDAEHIAKASCCSLNIESQRIPLNALSIQQFGQSQALQFALSGGDDYQLLFTASACKRKEIETLNCYRIGSVIKSLAENNNTQDHQVLLDGQPILDKITGYQHF
jgi:thiamine-monophosphate kinase